MTTIAFRYGTLAADRRVSDSSRGLIEGGTTKVFRRKDGCLVGVAGSLGIANRFVRWFLGGEVGEAPSLRDKDANATAEAIIIRSNGQIENYYELGIIIAETEYYAIGSGATAALAAMDMGADARRAVEIACGRDAGSGNGIDSVHVDIPTAPDEPARTASGTETGGEDGEGGLRTETHPSDDVIFSLEKRFEALPAHRQQEPEGQESIQHEDKAEQLSFKDANALDDIAVRVERDGKVISAFVSELSYIAPSELEDMAAGAAILGLIKRDYGWRYDNFEDVYVNDCRKPARGDEGTGGDSDGAASNEQSLNNSEPAPQVSSEQSDGIFQQQTEQALGQKLEDVDA